MLSSEKIAKRNPEMFIWQRWMSDGFESLEEKFGQKPSLLIQAECLYQRESIKSQSFIYKARCV